MIVIQCDSWSELDANVTCKSLGFSNGTFYNYAPVNNLTNHMKLFMPRCTGSERDLLECRGAAHPELGLTACGNLTFPIEYPFCL